MLKSMTQLRIFCLTAPVLTRFLATCHRLGYWDDKICKNNMGRLRIMSVIVEKLLKNSQKSWKEDLFDYWKCYYFLKKDSISPCIKVFWGSTRNTEGMLYIVRIVTTSCRVRMALRGEVELPSVRQGFIFFHVTVFLKLCNVWSPRQCTKSRSITVQIIYFFLSFLHMNFCASTGLMECKFSAKWRTNHVVNLWEYYCVHCVSKSARKGSRKVKVSLLLRMKTGY